ncbi:MAG TPA: tail fiber domain-containing protein, partial [Chitinophagaceae bacterium]
VGFVDGTQWNKDNIGYHSFASGYNTKAIGWITTSMGNLTTASGEASTSMGYETTASGYVSTSMGNLTTASGEASTSMGYETTASGAYSTSTGNSTKAKAYASFTAGMYNDDTDNPIPNFRVATDRIFQIGNGDFFTKSNAITVLRNSNTGLGTITPTHQLEVIGPASATPVTLVIGNRNAFGPAAIEFVSDYGLDNVWRPGYIRSNDATGFTGSLEFYTNGTGFANRNGSLKGFEVKNGFAYTATDTVLLWSDARLKNNISAFTDGLNVISKINPVQFYYNADAPFKTDQQQVGAIAQDLEKIAPYMIEKNKQNGYNDLRSVNNQAYTFLLINAVKEQQQQIDKQQNQIETSEAKMKQLQQQQKQFETSSEEVKQLQ